MIKTHEKYEKYCFDISYGLLHFFSKSNHLLNLLAILFHNISNYETSLELFQFIHIKDPFRFESVDILSNILYVKD